MLQLFSICTVLDWENKKIYSLKIKSYELSNIRGCNKNLNCTRVSQAQTPGTESRKGCSGRCEQMFLWSHTLCRQPPTTDLLPLGSSRRGFTAPFSTAGNFFPCRWTQSQFGDQIAGKRQKLPVVIKVHEPVPL